MQVLINNNARFCYQSNEKVLSSNTLGRIQICKKKKMESVIDDDLEKSSSHESDSKSDKDNDESNE